jgi:hypothetical protein
MIELPGHLQEKYRIYAIHFDDGLKKSMIMVHVGRPMKFYSLIANYIFQHTELTVQKTGAKLQTGDIVGIQKIPNDNEPLYELTYDGNLLEINR